MVVSTLVREPRVLRQLRMAHAANAAEKRLNGLNFPRLSLLGFWKIEFAEERYEGSADLFYATSVYS